MSFWLDLYRCYRTVDILERRGNRSIAKNNKKIKEIEKRKQQQRQQKQQIENRKRPQTIKFEKNEFKKETKDVPNDIKLFNKYAKIIATKKFDDKGKMNMIRQIGSSGLDVESRKQLIELLNKLH